MGRLRWTISSFEIVCGVVLVLLAASLFIHDWYADAFCAPEYFECPSWAFMLAGFYFGGPILIFGTILRAKGRLAWLSQIPVIALALMVILYWAFP